MADLLLGAGVVLGVGSLAFRFLQYLYPVIPPVKLVQVLAGKVTEVPDNGVRFVHLPEGPVMLEKVGKEVRALSAICTHLGCTVSWHARRRQFICPCHHGIYAFDGAVLAGPPPRPLVKLPVVVRKAEVYVVMRELPKEGAA